MKRLLNSLLTLVKVNVTTFSLTMKSITSLERKKTLIQKINEGHSPKS